MFAGQVIAGACESVTVTVKVHEPVLPLGSVAVQVTVVVPFTKVEPDAGEQLTVTVPAQLSFGVGVGYSNAEHPGAGIAAPVRRRPGDGGCAFQESRTACRRADHGADS